jgi:hypothetical protein
VSRLGLHIHWAWVPAGTFGIVTGYFRFGWAWTAVIVVVGLSVGLFAEWRARKRNASEQ